MIEPSRPELKWVAPIALCLAVGFTALMIQFVGLAIGNRSMWVPAAVVFPLAFVATLVCSALLIRQLVTSRNR